jgi:integrase
MRDFFSSSSKPKQDKPTENCAAKQSRCCIAGLPPGIGVWKVATNRGGLWKVRLGKRFTGGKVIVKHFKTLERAKTWLFGPKETRGTEFQSGMLSLVDESKSSVRQLTASQLNEAHDALITLGGAATLKEAVAFYMKHARPAGGVKSFNELLKFYLNLKRVKGVTPKHIQGLQSVGDMFAEDFGEIPVSLIKQEAAEEWLSELDLEPVTIGNRIRDLRCIFREAVRRGWCTSSPFANIQKPQAIPNEIVCLTPKEVARLLVHCPADLMPSLALKIFAGLRTSELLRLEWSQIGKAEVIVQARQSKTRKRRVVTIQPNLACWFTLAKHEEGLIWNKGQNAFHDAIARLAAAAEVGMKSNFFRRTFASYHFAKFKNENLTAAEMGNSPKVVYDHYRAVATTKTAELFWNIDPTTAKGVAEGKLAVIIGEGHEAGADDSLDIAALAGLRNLGFEALALALPSNLQPTLNQYFESARTDEDKQTFLLRWLSLEKVEPGNANSLFHLNRLCLLDAARDVGLTVHLIDSPLAFSHGEEPVPDSRIRGELSAAETGELYSRRNAEMTANILRLNTNGPGVIVVTGAMHSGHGAGRCSLDDRLAAVGYRVVSFVTPTSLTEVKLVSEGPGGRKLITAAGVEAGWSDNVTATANVLVGRVRDALAAGKRKPECG